MQQKNVDEAVDHSSPRAKSQLGNLMHKLETIDFTQSSDPQQSVGVFEVYTI